MFTPPRKDPKVTYTLALNHRKDQTIRDSIWPYMNNATEERLHLLVFRLQPHPTPQERKRFIGEFKKCLGDNWKTKVKEPKKIFDRIRERNETFSLQTVCIRKTNQKTQPNEKFTTDGKT